MVNFNFHLTLHIHSDKQTKHCKHSQQTGKLSSKWAIWKTPQTAVPKKNKNPRNQNVSLTISFAVNSIIWWQHMITRSHCGTCAFFKRDSNMYEIQYQQLSSYSKSMVGSYPKGSLFFFFLIQQSLNHDKGQKCNTKYIETAKAFSHHDQNHIYLNHRCHIRTKQNRTKITLYTKKLEHTSTNYPETPGRCQWATICNIITR